MRFRGNDVTRLAIRRRAELQEVRSSQPSSHAPQRTNPDQMTEFFLLLSWSTVRMLLRGEFRDTRGLPVLPPRATRSWDDLDAPSVI